MRVLNSLDFGIMNYWNNWNHECIRPSNHSRQLGSKQSMQKSSPDPTTVTGGAAVAGDGSVSVGNEGDVVRINGGVLIWVRDEKKNKTKLGELSLEKISFFSIRSEARGKRVNYQMENFAMKSLGTSWLFWNLLGPFNSNLSYLGPHCKFPKIGYGKDKRE